MVHLLQPFGLFAGEVRRLERILRMEVMALTGQGPTSSKRSSRETSAASNGQRLSSYLFDIVQAAVSTVAHEGCGDLVRRGVGVVRPHVDILLHVTRQQLPEPRRTLIHDQS